PPDLPSDVRDEISAFLDTLDWRTRLPASPRRPGTILPRPGAYEADAPPVRAALSPNQSLLLEYLRHERELAEDHRGRLAPRVYGGQRGYAYFGAPESDPLPAAVRAGDAETQRVRGILWRTIGRQEGGIAAINTYDVQVLTWGRGFAARTGQLPEVVAALRAARSSAYARLLDAGIDCTREGNQWVWRVVDGTSGVVETGRNALELLRFDRTLLSLLVELSLRHGQDLADAQWQILARHAANVPAQVLREAWSAEALELAAKLLHWGGGTWDRFAATRGSVEAIYRAFLAAKAKPRRGDASGARFVGPLVTRGLLRKLEETAKGPSRVGPGLLGVAAPLPARPAPGSLTGFVFLCQPAVRQTTTECQTGLFHKVKVV
ncbi:MAG: hypothetical protein LC623_07330, partial [Halobacteriales archaeon]|nr:hypothetical protein [Halobacteriales archaeon]